MDLKVRNLPRVLYNSLDMAGEMKILVFVSSHSTMPFCHLSCFNPNFKSIFFDIYKRTKQIESTFEGMIHFAKWFLEWRQKISLYSGHNVNSTLNNKYHSSSDPLRVFSTTSGSWPRTLCSVHSFHLADSSSHALFHQFLCLPSSSEEVTNS